MSNILRQHIERIVPLTNEEYDLVLAHFTAKRFKKHQIIIREGEQVYNDYFLLSGLMKSAHINAEGREHILLFAMQNWWITDLQAYHHQTPATLQIDCLEDSETLFISLDKREKLCRELQKMETFFRKKTTEDSILLQRRIQCLISGSAKERYESLLAQYPGLFQRVPKTLIASYLGVTRETLSRLA
ncbi:Crp/Fnr family transcriptional regulator [Longitalea arenae]|uniref:Crp/Fnr family transcriptional regulator n=1 Tax=Longitalea arenae TaxID=2812558 RepID=UPI001967DE9A|nr:Crp/Fnr family transcriptional regulator [Longitalea arenae]